MKLVCWNVNGIRSALNKGLAAFVKKERPDFLCLQETKIDESLAPDMADGLPDYNALFSCAHKKGYSGVATFLGERVKEPKDISGRLGKAVFDNEGRTIISKHQAFTLYNLYFPSGTTGDHRQSFKYKYLDFLYAHLKKLSPRERGKLIICGDFNICHKEIDIHHPHEAEKRKLTGFLPDERAWMDRFVELGFVDTFRHVHGPDKQQFTWWSQRSGARKKNLGWRIDYIFVGKSLAKKITAAKILDKVPGSDHCPIVLELKL